MEWITALASELGKWEDLLKAEVDEKYGIVHPIQCTRLITK